MILTLSNAAPAYNGRLDGTIITSNGLRAVARSRSRPASKRQRQHWSPPFSLAAAQSAWTSLGTSAQEDWESYAAAFVTWPIEGSPRYATGRDSFANFYTVRLLIDPLATIPDAPSEGVTWQTRPKFFPFATWESGFYTLKAETDFEFETQILFSAVPPSKTVFNGEWYGEKIVGSEIFYDGLFPNDEYDGIHDMIESQFGSIDSTQKIWGRVWEVAADGGSVRVLKDPCTIDPTTPVPSTGLAITVYNDWDSDAFYCWVTVYNSDYDNIGEIIIEEIPAFEEASEDIVFVEGYGQEDVQDIEFVTQWYDMESGYDYLTYDNSNPYEFSILPYI
jgi:hypothetical protein